MSGAPVRNSRHRHRFAACVAFMLALAASACVTTNHAEMHATVRVFKYTGSVQCVGGGIDLPAMARQLTDAGLQVLSSACGTDGLMRAAVCGTSDGRIGIFELSANDAQAASKLGFMPLSELREARIVPCK
jgi:hypothetical protein